jgi:(R,R)-butanediol dehydrogenase/meso-butanediol dehydrogenase/diacetyl reductase
VKAAVYHGPRDIRIENVPVPEPGANELLIEVSRNGICGSDVHTYVGASKGGASMHVSGVVLGHEFAGVVREIGDGVTKTQIGARVAIAPIEWCGTCYACERSLPNLCRKLALYGGYRLPLNGGLAPFVCVSERSAFPISDELNIDHAALAEPMAVAVHAARRAPQLNGATVMILGAGPIGLGILQTAIASGASTTIVTETSAARRTVASELGASVVIDPLANDPRTAVRDLTQQGVDVVFETTANPTAFDQGIRSLCPRGSLVSVAGWGDLAQIDMGVAMAKELDIRFTMTYEPSIDFPETLTMLARGQLNAAAMISDHIPLDKLVDSGLEALIHHADEHVKILVDPS